MPRRRRPGSRARMMPDSEGSRLRRCSTYDARLCDFRRRKRRAANPQPPKVISTRRACLAGHPRARAARGDPDRAAGAPPASQRVGHRLGAAQRQRLIGRALAGRRRHSRSPRSRPAGRRRRRARRSSITRSRPCGSSSVAAALEIDAGRASSDQRALGLGQRGQRRLLAVADLRRIGWTFQLLEPAVEVDLRVAALDRRCVAGAAFERPQQPLAQRERLACAGRRHRRGSRPCPARPRRPASRCSRLVVEVVPVVGGRTSDHRRRRAAGSPAFSCSLNGPPIASVFSGGKAVVQAPSRAAGPPAAAACSRLRIAVHSQPWRSGSHPAGAATARAALSGSSLPARGTQFVRHCAKIATSCVQRGGRRSRQAGLAQQLAHHARQRQAVEIARRAPEPGRRRAVVASARVSSSTKWVKTWRTGAGAGATRAAAGAWSSAASSTEPACAPGAGRQLVQAAQQALGRPPAEQDRAVRAAPAGRRARAAPAAPGAAARRGNCSAMPAAWARTGLAPRAGRAARRPRPAERWRRGPSAPGRGRRPVDRCASAAARAVSSGRGRRQRRLDPVQPRHHAEHVAVDRHRRLLERDRAERARAV